MLSIATDYVTDYGSPEPYLRRIAEAGFSRVHWCHHWCHDFFYEDCELEQIEKWLDKFGLKVLDIHASAGSEKNWSSLLEYERVAGAGLVKNRLEMAARLDTDVIVMHAKYGAGEPEEPERFWAQLFKSLDGLEPVARRLGVRIAIENGAPEMLDHISSNYPPDYIGICYDSGHGNHIDGMLDWLDKNKGRLIAVHLHDNDGQSDQHKIPFTGTIDWGRLAEIIAGSSYEKCMNLECLTRNSGVEDEKEFLKKSHGAGEKFSAMVDKYRKRGK